MHTITLTESAIIKLKDIIAEENNPSTKFRVFVQGGGCSGFQYGFTLDDTQNEDDFIRPSVKLRPSGRRCKRENCI